MSQILFKTTYEGQPVEVMAGWDNPFQHFYLTVFDLREDAPQETVWSTLDSPSVEDSISTGRLRAQLKTMGIGAPEEFWARVELREGSVRHKFDGNRWSR